MHLRSCQGKTGCILHPQAKGCGGIFVSASGTGEPRDRELRVLLDKPWTAEDSYRIDPHDPGSCGLTKEQFAEGEAQGLPHAILAEDQVVDPSLKLSSAQQALVLGSEPPYGPK